MYLNNFKWSKTMDLIKKKKKEQEDKRERETRMLKFHIFIVGGHLQR